MLNPLRRFRQWLADSEAARIADDLERARDRLELSFRHLQQIEERFERMENRVRMRLARGSRVLQEDGDAAIMRDIQRQSARRRPNGDDWPFDEEG